MNAFKALILCVALVLMTGSAALASTPELFLETGATSVTVVGGAGTVTYNNTDFGGWDIQLVFGDSNSPSDVPFGIDITSLEAACDSGHACSDLDIWLSDTGFTSSATSFTNTYSLTSDSGSASTTQYAWDDPSDAIFGTTGSDGANYIGKVGPLSAGGTGGSVTGGGPETGTPPYSLTLEDVFAGCRSNSCVFYSSDGAISGSVPEPGAVVLFGTVLTLCASKLRRRRAS
jgi:hypothetical protein